MRNAGLEEAQAGIKIAGRNINNLRYAHDTTLMAESEEELKSLLTRLTKRSVFHRHDQLAAIFVPSVGLENVISYIEDLTKFTQKTLNDSN